jgi:hypothetical protein
MKQDAFEAIDRLVGRGTGMSGGLSPNDVLVQIALPLVLILAIATRLITMGQALTDQDRGAIILDLWKQQLILRMEQVLTRWEQKAELPAFPDPDRIRWVDGWPDDARFARLCRATQELENIDELSWTLYREALAYKPPVEADAGVFFPLHDPLLAATPPEHMPADFVMDYARRAFALDYLRERGLQWRERVTTLQWSVVGEAVAHLSPEDPLSDGRLAVQLRRISAALAARDMPLLPSVAGAYGEE